MISRREWLGITLGAGSALALDPRLLDALLQGEIIQREIPSTGEMLPVIGLGSSATFSQLARRDEIEALTEVIRAMVDRGARVFDTAPSYGASEQVAGDIARQLGVTNKIFWATKVNVAGRGGGTADPAAARAQIEESFRKLQASPIDLIQVHNLGDVPTQLGILKELKQSGRIRYLGVTTTSKGQYDQLQQIMRSEPLDFIGIDYAVDNRDVEESILPLAAERKIGVLVYMPFGRARLWQRVEGVELPPWAADFDAKTWAQFFLKYVVSHPAVTAVTPATSQASHMLDDIAGGIGHLPNEELRLKMAAFVDELPPAPARQRPGD
jgi:aryl-alcohol dehydrogenase-like predicted oxidoreductase